MDLVKFLDVSSKQYICQKCGKYMMDENGDTLIGISIEINLDSVLADSFTEEFIRKQLGKYQPDTKYSFCFECWLDSLMGNKENKND